MRFAKTVIAFALGSICLSAIAADKQVEKDADEQNPRSLYRQYAASNVVVSSFVMPLVEEVYAATKQVPSSLADLKSKSPAKAKRLKAEIGELARVSGVSVQYANKTIALKSADGSPLITYKFSKIDSEGAVTWRCTVSKPLEARLEKLNAHMGGNTSIFNIGGLDCRSEDVFPTMLFGAW